MLFNLWKKLEKKKKYLSNTKETLDYMHFINREIYLTSISFSEVEELNATIKLWNTEDMKKGLTQSQRKPIIIYINSHGCSLDYALAIADIIKLSSTPIYTVNICSTYKESMLIYLAGHKRYAYPSSTFMLEPFTIIEDVDLNNHYMTIVKNLFLEKASITENQLDKYFKSKIYFTAKEAQEVFICNEVIK